MPRPRRPVTWAVVWLSHPGLHPPATLRHRGGLTEPDALRLARSLDWRLGALAQPETPERAPRAPELDSDPIW